MRIKNRIYLKKKTLIHFRLIITAKKYTQPTELTLHMKMLKIYLLCRIK